MGGAVTLIAKYCQMKIADAFGRQVSEVTRLSGALARDVFASSAEGGDRVL